MTNIFLFPIRFLVFAAGFFFYVMEEGANRLVGAFAKTQYARKGSCNRCGRCCRLLALEMPHYISRREYLVRFLIWWHKVGLNFHFEGKEKNWLIYSCAYLNDGDKPSCRIYPFRHRLCRQYPKQPLYGHPKTHKECGFRFKRRDGKPSFDEILEEKSRFVYQSAGPSIEGEEKI